jgi:hypothetical protein
MARNLAVSAAFIDECEDPGWFDSAGAVTKTLKLYCKFNGADWTEITDYVESLSIHGAMANMTGSPAPGSLSVTLQNKDRRFSDLYPSSDYYGNLKPNKEVKVELSITSETAILFTGRVDETGWAEERSGGDGTATITCTDDAGKLQTKLFEKDVVFVGKKLAATSQVDSVLKQVLCTYGGIATSAVVVNGLVDVTVPYAQFRSGQSIWSAVESIAKSALTSYCGFGADGKFYFDSMLVSGWTDPSSEYEVSSADLGLTLTKNIVPMMGNHVKVRGSNLVLNTSEATLLWSLKNVKQVGKNALFPTLCWEVVAAGDYFLCDPTASPPLRYFARYEVKGGEVIYTDNLSISQLAFGGSVPTRRLTTTSSELDWSPTQGELVLVNDQMGPITIMNLEIKGNAVIRKTLASRHTDTDGKINEAWYNPRRAIGMTDDDLKWGRVVIVTDLSSETEYGEKWLTVSDDLIVGIDQTAKISDYWLKRGSGPKHSFSLRGLPFLAFLQPAAIITLTIAELGFGASCMLTGYTHTISQGDAETTMELEEQQLWEVTSESVGSVYQVEAGAGDIGSGAPATPALVTVGASTCADLTDYKCSGTDDQNLLLYVADLLSTNNDGGVIQLTEGAYYLSSSLTLPSGVALWGRGTATVVVNQYNGIGIKCAGSSEAHKSGVSIRDMTITAASSDTYNAGIVYLDYVDNAEVSGCRFTDLPGIGIQALHSTARLAGNTFDDIDLTGISVSWCKGSVVQNHFTGYFGLQCIFVGIAAGMLVEGNSIADVVGSDEAFHAISISGSDRAEISHNTIAGVEATGTVTGIAAVDGSANCKIHGNNISDLADMTLGYGYTIGIWIASLATANVVDSNFCLNNGQLIDRGTCEYAQPPAMFGETTNTLVNCTFARITSEAHSGTYCYLFKKTIAAGTAANDFLAENVLTNDLHGVVPGRTNTLSAWIKIPSSEALGSECSINLRYYDGSWTTVSQACANIYGVYQEVTLAQAVPSSATGFGLYVGMAAAAASSETFRIDDIRLRPDGVENDYGQNFVDAGTGTLTGGNSWEL